MILLKLFLVFLRVGFFAIGGAYSFLPLLEKEVVQNYQWLGKSEFLDVTGMVTIFPGAISIKFATYTGYKVAGIPGAVVANIANLLPPVVLMMVASLAYAKYKGVPSVKTGFEMVQYAVFAMIIAVALGLVNTRHFLELRYMFVVIAAFILFALTKVHPALIIIGAALYGGLIGRFGGV